jgi:hypothetical protein
MHKNYLTWRFKGEISFFLEYIYYEFMDIFSEIYDKYSIPKKNLIIILEIDRKNTPGNFCVMSLGLYRINNKIVYNPTKYYLILNYIYIKKNNLYRKIIFSKIYYKFFKKIAKLC